MGASYSLFGGTLSINPALRKKENGLAQCPIFFVCDALRFFPKSGQVHQGFRMYFRDHSCSRHHISIVLIGAMAVVQQALKQYHFSAVPQILRSSKEDVNLSLLPGLLSDVSERQRSPILHWHVRRRTPAAARIPKMNMYFFC
jgi:hypothetical protein